MTLCSFWVFRLFTYGLETAIYLTLIACCVICSVSIVRQRTAPGLWGFALVAGASAITRIDFAAVVGCLLLYLVLVHKIRLDQFVLITLAIGLCLFPWLTYVFVTTGSWIPSSGRAEGGLITVEKPWPPSRGDAPRANAAGCPLVLPRGRPFLAIAALGSFALWAYLLRRQLGTLRHSDATAARLLTAWLLCLGGLAPIYVIAFASAHFYGRYMAPLLVITIPAIGITSAALLHLHRTVTIAVLASLAGVFLLTSFVSLHEAAIGNTQVVVAGFIEREVPTSVKVGAFQSGIAGFVNPNVVNLDGKVNAAALNARLDGQLERYIDAQGSDVIIDWESYMSGLDSRYLQREWAPCLPGFHVGAAICLARIGTPLAVSN